jgi:hypothetical protein
VSKRNLIIAGSGAVLFILIILSASGILKLTEEPTSPTTESEVIHGEVSSLASGKQTFEILTDPLKTFKIIEAEIDPLDVKKGESQQVRVLVKDSENKPITYENKVEGVVYTDNKTTPFSFELKEVSDDNGATITTWQGFWMLEDSYDNIYMINVIAKSADRQHSIDLTFR